MEPALVSPGYLTPGDSGNDAQRRSCSPQHGANAQRHPRRAWPRSVEERRGRRRFCGDLPWDKSKVRALPRCRLRIAPLGPLDPIRPSAPERWPSSLPPRRCDRHRGAAEDKRDDSCLLEPFRGVDCWRPPPSSELAPSPTNHHQIGSPPCVVAVRPKHCTVSVPSPFRALRASMRMALQASQYAGQLPCPVHNTEPGCTGTEEVLCI